jgi:carbohydrate diacid regulator
VLAAVAFNEAKTNYEEKHNKAAFVKNIISDNILPGDVYVRAKELHFVTDVPRAVLLVRQYDHPEIVSVEVIQNLFPDKQHDFVLSVSETDIVVIKELANPDDTAEVMGIAQNIEKALREQLQVKCVVGISTTARICASLPTATRRPRSPSTWAACSTPTRASSTTKIWAWAA